MVTELSGRTRPKNLNNPMLRLCVSIQKVDGLDPFLKQGPMRRRGWFRVQLDGYPLTCPLIP